MRNFSLTVFVLLSLLTGTVSASPQNPVEGAEYKTLTTPQPAVTDGKKVEVIEFFMYHCPACNQLEPQLLAWVSKQGSNIVFRRVHLPHTGTKDPEAHMFLALEALGLEESMHAKILNTWHVEHKPLLTDQDNIDWAVKNGIEKNKFTDAYFSFSVSGKLNGLMRTAGNYLVTSTPTLIIDGRYVTGPGMIVESNHSIPLSELNSAMLQVADALVAKAKAAR